MLFRRTNEESEDTVVGPCAPFVGALVNYNFAAKWCEVFFVEIKRPQSCM